MHNIYQIYLLLCQFIRFFKIQLIEILALSFIYINIITSQESYNSTNCQFLVFLNRNCWVINLHKLVNPITQAN